jgi:pyochelin biosynthesis protein PchG
LSILGTKNLAMISIDQRPSRVIVAGTTFGQVYLEALRRPSPSFELAGVLAQGSERSRSCARHYGVPLFTRVEDLPSGIDIACVVIRGSLLGGRGTELAQRLMARGIHVLQEHPLHHDEFADCLREARRHHVQYSLNAFYSYVPTVHRFVNVARALFRSRQPLYVDAACGFQVAYALLDILRATLGKVRPWSFRATPLPNANQSPCAETPFRSLDGIFGGVALSLRVQNQIHPSDPHNYAHLLHRITLGTDAGEVTLVSTHGPTVWSARPEVPREASNSDGQPLFAEAVDIGAATVQLEAPQQFSQGFIFRSIWPQAIRRALMEFRTAIEGGSDPLQRGQQQLTLCRVWQDIAAEIGPPELVRNDLPLRSLTTAELDSMRSAATEADVQID